MKTGLSDIFVGRERAWIKGQIKRRKERKKEGGGDGEGRKGERELSRNTKFPFQSISRQVNRPSGFGLITHRPCIHPRPNTRLPHPRLYTLNPSLTAASCPPLPSSARILEATTPATTPHPALSQPIPRGSIFHRTSARDIFKGPFGFP